MLSGLEKASEIFAGKRVLVTGGAGLSRIPYHRPSGRGGMRRSHCHRQYGARPSQNLARAMAHGNVHLIEGDICDRTLMASLVAGTDTVFHQAALRITQCAAEPRAALKTMVDATFDLLESCVASHVRKVVMASSASIYGMAESFQPRKKVRLSQPHSLRRRQGVRRGPAAILQRYVRP